MSSNPQDEQPGDSSRYWNPYHGTQPKQNTAHIPAPTTQVRGDPWQSVNALQLGLEPRTFDEVHRERMCLLEMLQQRDKRATDLFMRIPIVESRIHWSLDPEEQRQAKKHRGWLRHRIVDTVEEEKRILARLSELHVEIQCRERWYRVERDREMRKSTEPQPYSHELPTGKFQVQVPHSPTQTPAELPGDQPLQCTDAYGPSRQYPPENTLFELDNTEHVPTVEIFELDGTPIYAEASGSPSFYHEEPTEEYPTLVPKRSRSMPTLNCTSGENDKDYGENDACSLQ
ncbi:hypothetical protein M426DRAFT_12686 [Hypoxylon sp. CI-4A]|nr:hypothetical protein M426DRAFT_12686 [Hypoxylon sp. CI-4A]